jgi:cytochrome c553
MRVFRWILGGALVLVVMLLASVYYVTNWQMRQHGHVLNRQLLRVMHDSAARARGAHLTSTFAGCVDCHGPDFGGRVVVENPMIGRLVGSNLTTGRGGVLAAYSDAALDHAIRHGVAPDGRKLRFMPSHEFRGLADADVAAIIAFLRTRPPVDRVVPTTRIGPLARVLHLAGQFVLLPYDRIDHASPERETRRTATMKGVESSMRVASKGCVQPEPRSQHSA